jgi:hypothetical protein
MGTIIKFILAFIIISYLFNKVGKFFIDIFKNRSTERRDKNSSNDTERKTSFNKEGSSNRSFSAGEYVDYEEID